MHKNILLIAFILLLHCFHAQTKQDTLRGSITSERSWWNVKKYDLHITPSITKQKITGKNTITFYTARHGKRMQIDLQEPMEIDSIQFAEEKTTLSRTGNVYYINFENELFSDQEYTITIYFSGKPKKAVNAPWDGGWIWKKDSAGNPWVSVACQGLGASVWYPCKDHQSDEPELGAKIAITVPSELKAISNGKLVGNTTIDKLTTYYWEVKNPINNYNVAVYIGKYVTWKDSYLGEKGTLPIDYWVLEPNLAKAKQQFMQTKGMLTCFENWFGPYPFYEDGFKLVEAPFLGMENQSAIAYGNNFQNGYAGTDRSNSGMGTDWDYILVHESGHEWFGNNITSKDIADMWIHEAFTSYSEVLFVECLKGKEAANKYAQGDRRNTDNDKPIIGQYNINKEGSVDMYSKGSAMIHTIRQLINNDEKFKQLLRGMNKQYWHTTVTTEQIESYMIENSGLKLAKIFDQYLRTNKIPTLEYKQTQTGIDYRWTNCVQDFDMQIKLQNGKFLETTQNWNELKNTKIEDFQVDFNLYINVVKVD
jgi:aminopeptidase N